MLSVLGLALVAGTWLFGGVYRTREWQELGVFVKHRPTFKVFFHAPLGEVNPSSMPGHEGYLTAEQWREERAYVEFVEQRWLR